MSSPLLWRRSNTQERLTNYVRELSRSNAQVALLQNRTNILTESVLDKTRIIKEKDEEITQLKEKLQSYKDRCLKLAFDTVSSEITIKNLNEEIEELNKQLSRVSR